MNLAAERAAFEAWADSQWPGAKRQQLKRDNYGEYLNCIYRDMWRGWKARARLPVGVPDGLRIAIQQRDHYAARVGALELGLLRIADDFYPDNDSEMALALGEMREAVRSLVAAAPTVKAEQVQCPYCQGHGDVTRISGQTAESYSEHNEECPECSGTGLAPSLPAAQDQGEVQRLREALEGMLEYFPEGASDGECFAVDAARAALSAQQSATGLAVEFSGCAFDGGPIPRVICCEVIEAATVSPAAGSAQP